MRERLQLSSRPSQQSSLSCFFCVWSVLWLVAGWFVLGLSWVSEEEGVGVECDRTGERQLSRQWVIPFCNATQSCMTKHCTAHLRNVPEPCNVVPCECCVDQTRHIWSKSGALHDDKVHGEQLRTYQQRRDGVEEISKDLMYVSSWERWWQRVEEWRETICDTTGCWRNICGLWRLSRYSIVSMTLSLLYSVFCIYLVSTRFSSVSVCSAFADEVTLKKVEERRSGEGRWRQC